MLRSVKIMTPAKLNEWLYRHAKEKPCTNEKKKISLQGLPRTINKFSCLFVLFYTTMKTTQNTVDFMVYYYYTFYNLRYFFFFKYDKQKKRIIAIHEIAPKRL